MKYIYLFTVFLFYTSIVFAQSEIKGQVIDEDGYPVAGATVEIKGSSDLFKTDAQGNFIITTQKDFPFVITARNIAYESGELTITDGSKFWKIVLTESATELQQVEIMGRKGRGYRPEYTYSATKTGTAIMDIPQSVAVVNKELIKDQQGFRVGDVVKNVSGVNQYSSYDDFTLRGFRSRTQMINGLRLITGFWSQANLVNVERVEVIKGPAAALFGNTDPGGTINKVTKRPLLENKKAISFTTGSYNTYRTTVDLTGPANESKTLLYRLNLGYESNETFKTLQGFQDITIAPSITFIPNERTKVNFDLAYSFTAGKLYRGQPIFGASAGTDLNSTPISFAIAKGNDYLKEVNFYSTISLTHQLSDNLSFNASYLKYNYRERLQEHRTSNNYAKLANGEVDPTKMEMRFNQRFTNTYNDNITTYFVQKLTTGPLEHQFVVGYDANVLSVPAGSSGLVGNGYRNEQDANGNPIPNIPHFDLINPNYSFANINQYNLVSNATAEARAVYQGVYIQDQIKWNNLSVLLGLRQEFTKDYVDYNKESESEINQKALIPRIGLVYSVYPNINAYATYVQGFVPQNAESLANPNTGGPFDPLTSNMIEAGLKGEFFNKRVMASVGIYQIEQNNVLVNAQDEANPELLMQRGQERARGIEFDFAGSVTRDFKVSLNYAYNKTLITEDSNPEKVGTMKENAPLHQGGLWAKYSITSGNIKGIGFGLGTNFVSERNTLSPILTLPGYQLVDAAVYYTYDNFQLSFNLNNVLNKTHWVGGYDYNRLFPGTPRNFLVGVSYTF